MMARGFRWATMLVLVPLVIALAACGSSSSSSDDGGGAAATSSGSSSASTDSGGGSTEKVKISLALGTPAAMPMYPFYIAKAKGYFADEGLDVTINGVDGSAQTVQALASGAANMAGMTTSDVLPAVSTQPNFHPVLFFWSFYNSPLYVGAPDGSGIDTASDLRGKTIGVSALSGAETTVLKHLAASQGLKDGTDYQIKPVGTGGQAVVALQSHVIDGYAGGINDIAIITARGIPMHKVTAPGVKAPYGFGVWANEDLVKAHPEALEGFSRAYAKAWSSIGTDANKLVGEIGKISPQEGTDPKVSLALAQSSIDLRKPPANLSDKLGYIPPKEFARWYQLAGAKLPGGPQDYFTNDYNGSSGS